jgi:hypothetical protein
MSILLVKGDTFSLRDQLRALGGAWDGPRQGWLLHPQAAGALEGIEGIEVRPVPALFDLLVTGNTYPARKSLGPIGAWDRPRNAWRIPAELRDEVEAIARERRLVFRIDEAPPKQLPSPPPQAVQPIEAITATTPQESEATPTPAPTTPEEAFLAASGPAMADGEPLNDYNRILRGLAAALELHGMTSQDPQGLSWEASRPFPPPTRQREPQGRLPGRPTGPRYGMGGGPAHPDGRPAGVRHEHFLPDPHGTAR